MEISFSVIYMYHYDACMIKCRNACTWDINSAAQLL